MHRHQLLLPMLNPRTPHLVRASRGAPAGLVALVLLLGSAAAPSPALARRKAQHRALHQGIEAVRRLEDKKALVLLGRALHEGGNRRADLAQIHLYMGIARANLFETQRAKDEFAAALTYEAAVKLPPLTAPKIRDLFEEVRRGRAAGRGASPAAPFSDGRAVAPNADDETVAPRPAPVEPSAATPALVPRPAPAPTDAPPSSPTRSALAWPVWLCLGIGVAAGATGIGLGVSARSENEKSQDLTLTSSAADAHASSASSQALGANILFGVAGAAVLTAAVLFIVKWNKANSPRVVAWSAASRGSVAGIEARW
jgi:hypothetical protein